MLTDFTQFLWFWAGDELFVILAFTVAGSILLSILHMLTQGARQR